MNHSDEIWVFLSHSHEDYEKVRKVRDMLEDQRMRPIMFFLKCLNDHDEIDSLIKREIDCRTRFILCDSENARKSDWVKEEVKYIKSQDRIYETIDLDLPVEIIKKKLSEFKRKATLFLSYSRVDHDLAESVYERLSKYDFQVFFDIETLTHGNFAEQIMDSLNNAVSNGYIIAILNERLLNGECWSRHEIVKALMYDKEYGGMSILPFSINNGLIDKLASDKELNCLLNYSIQDIANKPIGIQSDDVVNFVLKKLLTPGTILTHAHNFSKGINCKVDEAEANKLYALYFQLADQATDNGSDSAWRALGECYEMGWGTHVDLKKALECYQCYKDAFGCKEDAERVILKLRGEWNLQNDPLVKTKQSIITRLKNYLNSICESSILFLKR